MRKIVWGVELIAVLFCLCASVQANIRLPHVISDHAVLQRDRPIHLWGWASAGARIEAQFHGQQSFAVADPRGKWNLYLRPEPAGGPYTLTLSGDGPNLVVQDILVGDVWIASGQSNMEMPLEGFGPSTPIKNQAAEIAAANLPQLRLLRLDRKSSDIPLADQPANWTLCTPETARQFSAVAYFFGRAIVEREKVPIGLIDATWGGTPADSWVSMDTLGTNPDLLPAFASRARFADERIDLESTIAMEAAEDKAAQAEGKPKPQHPWHPDETSWLPAGLYNGMIAPLTPLTIKGFLWYQGETNSAPERAPYYRELFRALIGDWRSHFAQGDLPFLYAQISSFDSPHEDWGMVRDAQRRALAVANTAMAVTLDVGDAKNVHPADKQTVGARLARAAFHIAYGEPDESFGPMFREATLEIAADGQGALRVWFDHAQGLTARGVKLSDFEIAGADRRFVPADAEIQGETVVVRAATVPRPEFVRYGWSNVVNSYIYNAVGLPAPAFSSAADTEP
jgi:sialate O-acetylesterase